jgi:hypothetical protein
MDSYDEKKKICQKGSNSRGKEKYSEKVIFLDYFGFNPKEKVDIFPFPTKYKAFFEISKMGQLRLLMDIMPFESL